MRFKAFDVEQAPAAQGHEPHSYDVVVACNVLHATASLQRTLENIRQLLKPGGYLVFLEQTDNAPVRFTTIMGGLPAWWSGVHDGRKYAPTTTPGDWHSALRKAGFGGIDAITPKMDGSTSAWPFSVMAAQAIDDQVGFLRRPLSSSSSHVFIDSLVILGTGSLESCRIAEELSDSLGRFCGNVTILNGLPTETDALTLHPISTFVNLVDLDSPIFKAMTKDKMEGLKRIFELARHIMWVTRGVHLGEEPYHAASLAFCRSLSNEATHVSVNVLDISDMDDNVSKVVAEQLLRQCALEEWDPEHLMWSKEPETILHNGKLLLPRILPSIDQNARLNASRRVITKKVPVSTSSFSIISERAASLPCLVEDTISPRTRKHQQASLVRVESSSLMALHVKPDAFLFIAIGKTDFAGSPVVVASTTNSLTTAPVASFPVPDAGSAIGVDSLLVAITSELLAASLIQSVPPGSSILVHCSHKDRVFAGALLRRGAAKGVRVSFSCAAEDTENLDPSWIRLGSRVTRHVVRQTLLPVQPTHFLDLTTHPQSGVVHPTTSVVSLKVEKVLPIGCKRMDLSDLSQRRASLPRSFDREALISELQAAVSGAETTIAAASSTHQDHFRDVVLHIDQIYDRSAPQHTTSIVHWPVDGEVEVEVRPLDGQNLFSKEKTYVLFGLSGQVGQSLCEWMVNNGAGCVCLTSRHPNVDQGWLEAIQSTKATVKVLAADVTDRRSLDGVLKAIRETCPPIAGVANGANVLSDAPFDGMSTEMMLQALGPKIDGSYNLDQAFYSDDLDFFVLFSSISCVIGTSGQSNYVAANGYLNGLARQRRRRGLAASAFDIGLILGIGLAEVAGQQVVDSLRKYGITPLSEPDVRLAFAESIQAGYTNPSDQERGALPTAVMTSGLRTITTDEVDMVWYNNPIFSHLVIDTKGADGAGDQSRSKTAALPIKDQIAGASSKEAALEALKGKPKYLLGSTSQANMELRIFLGKAPGRATKRRSGDLSRCSPCRAWNRFTCCCRGAVLVLEGAQG